MIKIIDLPNIVFYDKILNYYYDKLDDEKKILSISIVQLSRYYVKIPIGDRKYFYIINDKGINARNKQKLFKNKHNESRKTTR